MTEEKKKSWFRRYWILSIFLGIFLGLVLFGFFQAIFEGIENDVTKNDIISISTSQLLPQEYEIDREWILSDLKSLSEDFSGFIEGNELTVSKTDGLTGTKIIMQVYRLDSIQNAKNYYNQEIENINIRGVKDLDLGDNCFGIDQEVMLSGSAQGYCVKNNLVVYLSSASSSFMYASDLKDFKNIILDKI